MEGAAAAGGGRSSKKQLALLPGEELLLRQDDMARPRRFFKHSTAAQRDLRQLQRQEPERRHRATARRCYSMPMA